MHVINSAGRVTVYSVEVASTPAAINHGLMYRQSLGSGSGMLFLLGGNGYHTFTMVNMNFPLDIIFINSGLTIVNIAANAQPGTVSVPSGAACAYVLEINGGQCGANGIRTGDHIRIGPYSDPATPTPVATPTPAPTATPTPAPTPAPTATPTPVPNATVKPSGSPTPTITPHDNQTDGTANSATPTPVPGSTTRILMPAKATSRPVSPSTVSRDNFSVTPAPQPSVSSAPAALSPMIIPALAQAENGSAPYMADISSLAGLDVFIVCIGLIFIAVVRWRHKK